MNPKSSEIALSRFTISIGPGLGFVEGVLRVAEELAACAAEALRFHQDPVAPFAAGGAVGCTWHFLCLLLNGLFFS